MAVKKLLKRLRHGTVMNMEELQDVEFRVEQKQRYMMDLLALFLFVLLQAVALGLRKGAQAPKI